MRAWLESGKRPSATLIASSSPHKKAVINVEEEEVVEEVSRREKADVLVAMEEFKDQRLVVRKGVIYCEACKTEIPCEAPSFAAALFPEASGLCSV